MKKPTILKPGVYDATLYKTRIIVFGEYAGTGYGIQVKLTYKVTKGKYKGKKVTSIMEATNEN